MKARISLAATLLTSAAAQVSAQSTSSLEQDRKILQEACQALKGPEKRTLCHESINRLTQVKASQPLAAEKVAAQTRELITLKGVPFDTPDSKDAVQKLCILPNQHYTRDTWCNFSEKGRISMPSLGYGNLTDNLAWAVVDKDGSLIKFETSGSKGEMLDLASLLSEKYGKPVVTEKQIENKLGTKFDQKIFVWVDQRGTRITIHSIYDKIDSGRIIIESASLVKLGDAVQQLRHEAGKSNL
jgi:hypothetical protein